MEGFSLSGLLQSHVDYIYCSSLLWSDISSIWFVNNNFCSFILPLTDNVQVMDFLFMHIYSLQNCYLKGYLTNYALDMWYCRFLRKCHVLYTCSRFAVTVNICWGFPPWRLPIGNFVHNLKQNNQFHQWYSIVKVWRSKQTTQKLI